VSRLAGFEQVSRYAELVYRVLGEDLEFLPPGFIIERDRPEWAIHKREVLWSIDLVVAAVVGANSIIAVENPGTDMLSVISAFDTTPAGVAQTVGVFLRAGVGTFGTGPVVQTTARPAVRDTRLINTAPRTIVRGFTVTAISIPTQNWAISDNSSQEFENVPFVLGPLTQAVFVGLTANTAMRLEIAGYERAARPEELAL